jgi:hypothetical protein
MQILLVMTIHVFRYLSCCSINGLTRTSVSISSTKVVSFTFDSHIRKRHLVLYSEQTSQVQVAPWEAQLAHAHEGPWAETRQFVHPHEGLCATWQLAQLQVSLWPIRQLGHPHPAAWFTATPKEEAEDASAVGDTNPRLLLAWVKAEAPGVLHAMQKIERAAVVRIIVFRIKKE